MHQSDNEFNKIAFVRHQNGTRLVEFQSETNGTRTTPAAPVVASNFPSTIQLRLTNVGGKLTRCLLGRRVHLDPAGRHARPQDPGRLPASV